MNIKKKLLNIKEQKTFINIVIFMSPFIVNTIGERYLNSKTSKNINISKN